MQEIWQKELNNVVTSCHELRKLANLSDVEIPKQNFKLKAPLNFINKIKKEDLSDPLLKQILPTQDETKFSTKNTKYLDDPVKESQFIKVPGLIHKYHSRVLLIISANCAMNCRFCFRRHFPYKGNHLNKENFTQAFEYIAANQTITEVIFSGGDPLTELDQTLNEFAEKLATIPHLTTLRIHSRIPIILPNRITQSFINWFSNLRLKPVLVTHCNHPNEIDELVIKKCKEMQKHNITLLNQTVLLKGINDCSKTLQNLSEKLFTASIIPYYIHLLDPVSGSNHFDASKEDVKKIRQELQSLVPGYLLPRFVREIPNKSSKTLLDYLY